MVPPDESASLMFLPLHAVKLLMPAYFVRPQLLDILDVVDLFSICCEPITCNHGCPPTALVFHHALLWGGGLFTVIVTSRRHVTSQRRRRYWAIKRIAYGYGRCPRCILRIITSLLSWQWPLLGNAPVYLLHRSTCSLPYCGLCRRHGPNRFVCSCVLCPPHIICLVGWLLNPQWPLLENPPPWLFKWSTCSHLCYVVTALDVSSVLLTSCLTGNGLALTTLHHICSNRVRAVCSVI